jgi:hypothetical protein
MNANFFVPSIANINDLYKFIILPYFTIQILYNSFFQVSTKYKKGLVNYHTTIKLGCTFMFHFNYSVSFNYM